MSVAGTNATNSVPVMSSVLRNSITELVNITCCVGFDNQPRFVLLSANKLQEFLAERNHRAQCYRWCAVLGFFIELEEAADHGEVATSPGETEGNSEYKANVVSTVASEGHRSRHGEPCIEEADMKETTARLNNTVLSATNQRDEAKEPDYGNVKSMFQKAYQLAPEKSLFRTAVTLEYALYLVLRENHTAAKDLVSSVTREALMEYRAVNVHHEGLGTCLVDVLKVSECQKTKALRRELSAIVQDLHGLDVEIKPLGVMVH